MRARGFTLLEFVIVLAIVGILAALALPSYQAYVYRAKAVEVVLVLDKIKAALATHEADLNRRLGSDLVIYASKRDVEVRSIIRGTTGTGPRSTAVVADLRPAELSLARQGLDALLVSGSPRTRDAGQYMVTLTWPASPRAGQPSPLEARQIALAVAEVMRPNVPKVEFGTRAVRIYFQLPGRSTSTSTSGTPSGPAVTGTPTVVPPPSQTPTTTPSVVTPPSQPTGTTTTTPVTQSSTTTTPAVTPQQPQNPPGNQNHPGNHGQGFAKGHSK